MDIQWFCQNIEAISGYSEEARIFLHGLKQAGIGVTLISSSKKKGNQQTTRQIDTSKPLVCHTFRHGECPYYDHPFPISRTMLEISTIPQNWVHLFNQLEQIWVPSAFNYSTFVNAGVEPDKVKIVPSPVEPVPQVSERRIKSKGKKRFTFLSVFNYAVKERKGLDILLKAYMETFRADEPVCLVLKTNASLDQINQDYNLDGRHAKIEIINRVFDRQELLDLYYQADVMAIPSRGEGVGRPFLDAMAVELPIITSDWGGSREFLNPENAFLVKTKLIDIAQDFYLKFPGFYGGQWAEPDLEDLKKTMAYLYHFPGQSLAKTRQGKKDRQSHEISRIIPPVSEYLSQLKPDKTVESKPHLFHRLYPVYYPKLKRSEDVARFFKKDFVSPLPQVALLGQKYPLKRCFHYLRQLMPVGNITLLKNDIYPDIPDGLGQHAVDFFTGIKKAQAIVMADYIDNITQVFPLIQTKVDWLPIYIFG